MIGGVRVRGEDGGVGNIYWGIGGGAGAGPLSFSLAAPEVEVAAVVVVVAIVAVVVVEVVVDAAAVEEVTCGDGAIGGGGAGPLSLEVLRWASSLFSA